MGQRQRKTPRKRRAELDPAVAAARTAPPAPVAGAGGAVLATASVEVDDDNFEQVFGDLFGQDEQMAAAIQTEVAEFSAAQRSAQRSAQLRCRSAGTSKNGDPLYARRAGAGTYVRPLKRATLQMAVERPTLKPKKRVLKLLPSGALASKTCDFCSPMPTNHFCRFALPSSNITIQGKEGKPICGAVACMNCKLLWPGEPEDYANRCRAHKR